MENTIGTIKHSIYFDGAVQSLALQTVKGRATVGVLLPGTYTFGTATAEEMVIVAGTLNAKLPGQTSFSTYEAGSTFNVPANASFEVTCDADVAYLCYYA